MHELYRHSHSEQISFTFPVSEQKCEIKTQLNIIQTKDSIPKQKKRKKCAETNRRIEKYKIKIG